MITVSGIPYRDIARHAELLAEYATECSHPTLGTPDPQWELYQQMQDAGMAQAFAVYSDEYMVGFASLLITTSPHYGCRVATVESLFVADAHRDSGAGSELMKVIEQYARHRECKAIIYSAPAGGQLEAVLGKRYPRAGSSYCKPLA